MARVIAQMLEYLSALEAGKTSEDFLKAASEFENERERFAYIETLFKNFRLKQPAPLVSKDSQRLVEKMFVDQAKSAMDHGGNLEYVLKRLNEGISWVSESDTLLLASIYALRAEVLLRSRQFEASAADAARATRLAEKVEAGWEVRLDKILALCRKLSVNDSHVDEETESGDSGAAPESLKMDDKKSEKVGAQLLCVEAPNPLVPCASEALTLNNFETGTHFVASRDIKPGEILMVEEPLVFTAEHKQFDRCSYCLKSVVATLPCGGCCFETYCGEKCKEEAQPLHVKECEYNAKLNSCVGDESVWYLLIKLILLKGPAVCRGTRSVAELMKAQSFDVMDNLLLVQPEVLDSTLSAVVCKALLQFIGIGADLQQDELVVAMACLLPYVAKATTSIEEVVIGGGYTGSDTFGKIGAAVYPVRALVALSCSPNAIAFNVGNKSVLQSTRLISAGSLVTQCSSPRHDFLRMPRGLRHSFLQRKCDCEACFSDWPTLDKLPASDEDLMALTLAQDQLTPHLMPFALEAAEELERRNLQHTRVFHALQERIRMALAMQGNVSRPKMNASGEFKNIWDVFA